MFRWDAFKHLDRLPEVAKCVSRIKNWQQIIPRYVGVMRRAYPIDLRTRSGLTIRLQTYVDVLTAWTIFCKDEYHVDPESEIVFDIGANIGLFTLLVSSIAPRATIIAVEPFPSTFDLLSENVQRSGLNARVTCQRVAIDGQDSVGFMDPLQNDWTITRRLVPESKTNGLHQVNVLSLASLFASKESLLAGRTVDLLKIDNEGSELNTILNADKQTLRRCRSIQVEYHSDEIRQRISDRLNSIGFALVQQRPDSDSRGILHFSRVEDRN